MRTVSGQFITYNAENGQYYIDPDKITDVDAKIEERAELVSAEQMTQYYYDALRQLFRNLPKSVYVPGYQIWSYELPWTEHNVTRPGYLFFGPPNKRSTAQPPRDFYIYFLSPFVPDDAAAPAATGRRSHLRRAGVDQELRTNVRRYAAARMLSLEAPTWPLNMPARRTIICVRSGVAGTQHQHSAAHPLSWRRTQRARGFGCHAQHR